MWCPYKNVPVVANRFKTFSDDDTDDFLSMRIVSWSMVPIDPGKNSHKNGPDNGRSLEVMGNGEIMRNECKRTLMVGFYC